MYHISFKHIYIALFICLCSSPSFSLDTIKVKTPFESISLFGSGAFFLDKTRALELNEVLAAEFSPETLFEKPKRPIHLDFNYWHKYIIHNDSDSMFRATLSSGHYSRQSLFLFEDDRLKLRIEYGTKVNKSAWPNPLSQRSCHLNIPPQTTYTALIKKVGPRNSYGIHVAKLTSPELYDSNIKKHFYSIRGHYYFRVFFIGILGFLFLFTIFQYLQHKDLAYLYYSGYLFVMTVYFMERHESNAFFNLFFSHNSWLFNSNGGGEPSYYAQLSFVFYLLFTIEFLDIKNKYVRLNKYLYGLIIVIIILYAIHLLMLLLNIDPSSIFNYYYTYRAILNIPLIIVLIWIAVKIRTRLALFFILGSTILTLSMIVPQFTYLIEKNIGGSFFNDNMTWMQVGILFECFLFSTGLGYKSKIAFEERDRIQQELITKSEENIALTLKYNTELEAEVKEKTSELFIQKEQLLKAEYEKDLVNLEAQLLQSKMNPHFIYNCLNSIKYFALSKSSEETAEYITDFSTLMRSILEHSRESLISLKDEVNFVKKYLIIESRRFDSRFSYKLDIDPNIEWHNCYIPPMILQPIIENAIVHGLLPKDELGHLDIRFTKESSSIKIEIEDNGVGRHVVSSSQDSEERIHKTSLSTIITSARLKKILTSQGIKIDLDFTDLKQPSGTLVTIQLPFIGRNFSPSISQNEFSKSQ